jgi:HPt (histidine-containing phosphotransfer) domain-containing protein
MERALGQDDLMALSKAGHTMKGALLNLGLDDCAKLALYIEERSRAADLTIDYATLVADLRKEIGPLINSG